MKKLLEHIGIIMDGNGRWAKRRGLPRIEGHRRGVRVAREISKDCSDLGIRYLTLYAFSLENWTRPSMEIALLMRLLRSYAIQERPFLMKHDMKLRLIGDRAALPKETRFELEKTVRLTRDNGGLTVQLALSYGGRDEILRAAKKMAERLRDEKAFDLDQVDVATFRQFLDTEDQPDPDLIIRTSGEQRLSNFLTWQSAYSEFYFSSFYWPDFNREELDRAIESFKRRDRRFGGLAPIEAPKLQLQ